MFEFDNEDNTGLTVRITGDAAKAVNEIAEVLELNDSWPILPLAIEKLHNICLAHKRSKELLRDVVMLDSKEENALFLFDIEKLKVEAKKLELNGLG